MSNNLLEVLGNVIAAVGIVVCAVAGINRLLGSYHLFGYEAMTFFIGGISLMVFAALIKLHIIKQLLAAR
jgi:type IV secretory pathway VirB2 component (pilin)